MPKGNHGKKPARPYNFSLFFFGLPGKNHVHPPCKKMHENVCKNKSMLLPVLILYCVKDRMPLLGGGVGGSGH